MKKEEILKKYKNEEVDEGEYCERIKPPVRKNEPVNADNSATECGQGNHINNLANNRDLLYIVSCLQA